MAHHLHSERWRELEGDFALAELFSHALAVIGKIKGGGKDVPAISDGVARAEYFAHHGLQCLHPVTRDPGACEEFKQRKAGTFKGGSAPAPAPAAPNAELRALAAQIEELQRKLAERDQRDAKPSGEKPSGEGSGEH